MRKASETRLHFVGIGGVGMSGIAEVFLNQGYRVTGSDLSESDATRKLAKMGAKIAIGHRTENVTDAHVVVVSSAVKSDNPEVLEAKRLRVPVIRRAEMLGELMRGKTGIAVAGTHGKTTTTSMLATVLTAAGLDPTIVVGGRVDSLGGGGAKLGEGRFVVAEADESDGSFLQLPATYGVITNIDNDHLDHFGNITEIENAFVDFVGKMPFYGLVAVCGEDPGVKRCLSRWSKPILTYGLSAEWDIYATQIQDRDLGSQFEVHARSKPGAPHRHLGRIQLEVPGRHNVLNALAVIGISLELGLSFSVIATGLSEFRGVKRRFEIHYRDENSRRMIVDDYGHHPTEIAATLAAARRYWQGRIIAIFQPHRYSRTVHCRDGFLSAFRDSDIVWIADIYAAGEEPIPGVSAESLANEIRQACGARPDVRYGGDLKRIQEEALRMFSDGDLILCMGAGSITKLASALAAQESVSV